jgi:hypothetical protein
VFIGIHLFYDLVSMLIQVIVYAERGIIRRSTTLDRPTDTQGNIFV